MKRAGIFIGLFAGIFLFALAVHILKAAGQADASGQDKITPFVLETEVYGFEYAPHGQLGFKTTFARRSDGTSVRVENLNPRNQEITGRQIRFMDGRFMTVVNAFKMKTTWRSVPAGQLERFKAQRLRGSPNCLRMAGEEMGGNDSAYMPNFDKFAQGAPAPALDISKPFNVQAVPKLDTPMGKAPNVLPRHFAPQPGLCSVPLLRMYPPPGEHFTIKQAPALSTNPAMAVQSLAPSCDERRSVPKLGIVVGPNPDRGWRVH